MEAQKLVEHLNSLLASVCNNNLELKFGNYQKMMRTIEASTYTVSSATGSTFNNLPQYLLCLMLKNRCISSIELRTYRNTVEISSKTHPMYEGRRYNLLLRAAAIIIASQLPVRQHTMRTRSQTLRSNKIKKLISRAIHPISTLLLVKYFNAENKEFNEFLKNNQIDKKNLTLQNVVKFDESRWENIDDDDIEYNSNFGEPLLLTVRFNKQNIERVQQLFIETLQRISCP